MKRNTVIVSVATGLALLAALAWAFRPRPVEVELGTATVGVFEQTIDEDGKTRLAERYVVSAPLAGRLARIALREGDTLEAGAVVATLAPALAPLLDERSARESQARVEGARSLLARADARIERAKVAVEQARVELARSEQLSKDGFIAPTKLDTDRLGALATRKELDAAVQERNVALHDLEQAQAALSALRQPAGTRGNTFEVCSPISGQVLRVLHQSEGMVAMGTPLLELGDLGRLEVVAELLTADALRTRPGTPVRIERWGGPQTLDGRVLRVEPAAFTKVSALGVEEQRVNVVIDLTTSRDHWKALGDGFRVGLRIVVLSEAQALQVPASAVFPLPGADDDRTGVFVIDNGHARLVPVTLRARHGTSAWIAQGLVAGTRVIIYPPAAVRDGVRVRERKV
jgi:HlyD family secretion protein